MAENSEQDLEKTRQYINEKMNGLLESIGEGYGEPLLDELIQRLERTIADFHQEVQDLLTQLKSNSKERREKMRQLLKANVAEVRVETATESEVPPEVSDFERRLESKKEKKNDDPDAAKELSESGKKEETKKRHLFVRKKKK